MKTSYIKNSEMEAIAESVLRSANLSTSWNSEIARIDVDQIIEFTYDLEIQWENIDHLSKSGNVFAAISPKRKIIYMNESKRDLFMQKMGTMNFSKAHELGHWVLHVTKQRDYEQLSFNDQELYLCRGGSSRSPEEIQADMFAASILMPKDIITNAINEIKKDRRVTFPDLYMLADQFEVSISALTIRVENLGLLYIRNNQVFMYKEEFTGQMSLI